jgi:hypothetical protein
MDHAMDKATEPKENGTYYPSINQIRIHILDSYGTREQRKSTCDSHKSVPSYQL